jgi:fibronectin-binding autotransporter adhesin
MKKNLAKIIGALAVAALSTVSAHAASGNWNADVAGNWSDATKWSSNPTVPGTVAGDTIGLTFNLTVARIVTIDTTSRTVGTLNFGDPTTSYFGYTLAASGGASLTFNNSGGGAQLNQSTVGGAADTISAPLSLADNLTVNNVNGLTFSGVVSSPGAVSFTKTGAGMLTLSGVNTFTPNNIFVNAGTLYFPRSGANAGTTGAFGNISGGGVQFYVSPGTTLSSGNNNWFGNQTVADANLPTINLTGGTMAITNNYTTIGALNLTNGAIVTSTGTGSATYQGFQLRGNVNVGGTSGSTMGGSKDYHLNANTTFNVNTTGGSGPDLTVSASLRNQSGDFASASGGLTKTGPGKMVMSGANTYTGDTYINEGVLQLGDGTSASGSIAGNIDNETTLIVANPGAVTLPGVIYSSSAAPVIKTGAGALTLSGANTYSGSTTVSNGVVLFAAPQSLTGSMTVADGAGVGVTATTDAVYYSPGSLTLGSSTGAKLQFGVFGTTTAVLNPTTLTINGTATINISSAPFAIGASYPLVANYTGGTLALGTQPPGYRGELTVSGTTVNYTVTNISVDVWTAAVSTNWDTTTANWTNTVGGNLYAANDLVQFDDSAAGTSPLLVNITPSAVTNYSMLVSNTAKSYIIGGLAIGGATHLTKDGTNTLTLTGTNTFTGPTTILAGTVEVGGAGQLGGGNYSTAITDNGTLSINSSAAQTLSGVISGSGILVKSNTGNLTLPSANTFSGGLTVSNGTAFLGNNSASGTGTITLAGGTLDNTINGLVLANNINVTAASGLRIDGGNWNLNGNFTGSGNLAYTAAGGAATLALVGDNSAYSGTFTISGANTAFQWNSASAGSANATWVLGNTFASGGRMRFVGWSGSIDIGALSGNGIGLINNTAGTVTMNVGALNTSTTFSGTMISGAGVIALTKVGTGSLTLTAANAYTGPTIIENGSLVASNNAPSGAAGAFGNSTAAIALGDYNNFSYNYTPSLLIGGAFTVSRPITVGVGPWGNTSVYTIGGSMDTNSTFSGNIFLNLNLTVSQVANSGTNVLTLSGTISSVDNGETVTFAGPGNIKVTAADTYSGNTLINGGKLILSGSGNIGSSAHINVGSGATYDVSGVTASPYTLGGSQTLLGSGSVTGAVATASSGSSISPATNGMVGTLTFANNLNLSSGATLYFDLSTSHASGNDQIAVGGTLMVGGSDTVHVNALSGSANLDATADYVLFNVAGTTTMPTQPGLLFDGTAPANASHYSVQKVGNNVVLHYSATAAPTVTSVIVTNTADGSTIAARYQTVTVYAVVSPGAGTITSVTANLTSIGGSAAQVMNNLGGNNYSYTATVGAGAQVGSDVITVTANDSLSNSGANSATLTVTAVAVTWSGFGADNLWGNGTNWMGNNPPGFSGDSVIFTGGTQTTADMNGNYAVTALTFDGGASSFTITNPAGTALTLNGTLENDSGSPQTLTTPIILSVPQIINDAGYAGITLASPVSGAGAVTVNGGYVTLAGSNSYAADTTVNGTLKVGNSAAIPSGSGKGNVMLAGTLDLNGTNAFINNLIGGAGVVDNTSPTDASTLTLGMNNDVINLTGVAIQNTGGTNLSLVKVGSGNLTISSANTFSGGLTVSNGTALLGNNSAAGIGTITLAGGTLNNTINGLVLANNINVTAASALLISGGNWNLNGNFTGSGNITYSPGGAANTLALVGDNSGYSGTFTITGANAAFQWGSASAGSANATWVLSNTFASGGRMRFGGWSGSIDIGALSGNGIGLINNTAGTVTMNVGALNTSTTFSGTMISGTGVIALTKVGTGTLTLSGANTYTGLTTVSNGTLVITTAHAGNGDFVVNDNKTLGVVNNGGSQTAMLNSLTLGDTAGPTTLFFTNVASTTIPVITVASTVTQNGTCNIAISNSVVNTGVYPLIKYGSLAGAGSFVLSSVPSGVTATLTNDTSNLWIALNVSVGNNVNTNPTNMTSVINGNQLVLSWPADHIGWRLQAQTNSLSTGLGTNWVDVPNTSTVNSYTNVINAANGSVFYRMVYP